MNGVVKFLAMAGVVSACAAGAQAVDMEEA